MKNKFYEFKEAFEVLKNKGIIQKDSSFIKITEGLVHDVRRIMSGGKTYYLKIRLDHFATDKKIKIIPTDIIFEKKAIERIDGRCPGMVPKIIYAQDNFFLLQNIKTKETKCVYDILYNQSISLKNIYRIGLEMKRFHQSVSKIKEKIRNQSEEISQYRNYLYWRFGIWKNKDLNLLVKNLRAKPGKQYIYGDFNPKNVFFDGKNMKLIDLETFHRGNTLFDLGFLGGHILLNFLNHTQQAKKLLEEFFSGYKLKEKDLNMTLRLVLATIYYRLKSNYDYKVNFSFNKKNILATIAKILSTKQNLTLDIITSL